MGVCKRVGGGKGRRARNKQLKRNGGVADEPIKDGEHVAMASSGSSIGVMHRPVNRRHFPIVLAVLGGVRDASRSSTGWFFSRLRGREVGGCSLHHAEGLVEFHLLITQSSVLEARLDYR